MKGKNKVKLIFASLLFFVGIVFVCLPLLIVWVGITAHLSSWGHIAVTSLGLFLCYLVKPVSILTGDDYHII